MGLFYIAPGWFFGIDVLLQLLFGLITGIVAFFSYKVYRMCDQKECKLLGLAFSFISSSYFLWAFLNFFFLDEVRNQTGIVSFDTLKSLPLIGAYAHIVLFIVGLCVLTYLTLNVKSDKIFTLITSLSLIVIIFSSNAFLAFNFVSALLLLYIIFFYFKRNLATKGKNILILAAFTFLFIARVDLVFAVIHHLPYVANHILELVAYLLMIVSLARVMRK